jgi:hypothetical protein
MSNVMNGKVENVGGAGAAASVLVNSRGNLLPRTGGRYANQTDALANEEQVLAAPGTLLKIAVYNSKASAQFIQVHDIAVTPGDGNAPVFVFPIAASSFLVVEFEVPCQVGIYVCNSSTAVDKTIGAADCTFVVCYDPASS